MSAAIVMLARRSDADLAAASRAGIDRYWGLPIRLFWDDEVPPSEVPNDIRALCKRFPPLKRFFDIPSLLTDDKLYFLDCDCFVFQNPADFDLAYQAGCVADNPAVVDAWGKLGIAFDMYPQLCAGMFSCYLKDVLAARGIAIEYLRHCDPEKETYGHGLWEYEQGLWAGFWKMTYPKNPLSKKRYPIYQPTEEQVIFHATGFKNHPGFSGWLREYGKLLYGNRN